MDTRSLFDKVNELCAGDLLDTGELDPDDSITANESQNEKLDLSFPSIDSLIKGVGRKKKNSKQAGPSAQAPVATSVAEEAVDETASLPMATRRSLRSGLRSASTTPDPKISKPQRGAATRGRGRGRGRKRGAAAAAKNSDRSAIAEVAARAQVVDSIDLSSSPVPPIAEMSDRSAIAEIAARAKVVDTIDLVTSPLPPITGVVKVDSDDSDAEDTMTSGIAFKLDSSFDVENPEVSVKVRWKGDVLRFCVRRYQKLKDVYKSLAEREKAPIEHVVLTLFDEILTPDDTPASINYKISHFIDGRIMIRTMNAYSSTGAKPKTKKDPNKIRLKIQSDKWKRPIELDIAKADKLKILYIKCGEELNVHYAKLKLSFDGELLDPNASPSDFELEGGEVVDLVIKE